MTRFGEVMTTYFATLGHRASRLSFTRPPKLIWNASASVPIGLYAVRPAGVLARHRAGRGQAAGSRSRASSPSAAICPKACRS